MSIIMIGIYCYRHALIHAVFVCSSYYYRWLNHYQCNMLKQLLFLSRPISNIMANILYALKNILIHHSNMESPFTNFFSFLLRILAPKTLDSWKIILANNDFSCPVALGEGSLLRRPRWHIPTPRPPDIGELSKLLAYWRLKFAHALC